MHPTNWEWVDQWQLGPRTTVHRGDPVRISDRRGLYRFVRVRIGDGRPMAEVIGPIGRAEGIRLISTALLKSAGSTPRSAVAPSPEENDLNARAHARSKKKSRK